MKETEVEFIKQELLVEEEIAKFESERVSNDKLLLLQYIHSELAFHANAVEKLSKLFAEVNAYDPKENLPVILLVI